ncbi:MAG: DUF433 domain-containing protein [Chloroflexota bacterium]
MADRNGNLNRATNRLILYSEEVLGGTPVFYGTRVPIINLIDYLEGGDSLEDFLTDFPSVSREQAIQVLELAKDSLLSIKQPV